MIKTGKISEKNFHVLCYAACIFLFAIGHTKIQNINFITGITVTYGKFIPLLLSALLMLRKARFNIHTVAVSAVFILLIGYAFIYRDFSYVIFFVAYFMIACSKSSEKQVFKYYTYVVFSVILLTIFLSLIGIIPNENEWYGRYDLGFTYCTFGPNLFLSACLALVAWKREKVSGKGWTTILLLNQFFFWKTETDAVYICVIALFILWLLIKNKKILKMIINNKILVLVLNHVFSIMATVTVIFQLYYNYHYMTIPMIYINKVLSTRPIMGRNVLLRYGPGLGKTIQELIFGMGVDKATYLDSSYLAILTAYGIPLLAFTCYLMNKMVKKAYKIQDLYLVVCLLVFAVHCITDPQLLSFRANPFIVTSLINFSINKAREKQMVETNIIIKTIQKA